MNLCDLCSAITPYALKEELFHQPSYDALRQSAESCELCALFQQGLENDAKDATGTAQGLEKIQSWHDNNEPTYIKLYAFKPLERLQNLEDEAGRLTLATLMVYCGPREENYNEAIAFQVDIFAATADDLAATSGDVACRHVERSSAHQGCFDTIEKWIADCCVQHFECTLSNIIPHDRSDARPDDASTNNDDGVNETPVQFSDRLGSQTTEESQIQRGTDNQSRLIQDYQLHELVSSRVELLENCTSARLRKMFLGAELGTLPVQLIAMEPHGKLVDMFMKPLPSRLLDVGFDLDSDEIVLKTTSEMFGIYMTLSHCWGSIASYTTTNETVTARQSRISIGDLPNTFRDAVRITRKLGVRYLWIDSLCIIQDNTADWEQESAKMADIYLNSFLTIAATSSTNSQSGCFAYRSPNPCVTIPYNCVDELGKGKAIGTGHMLISRKLTDFKHAVESAPLNERAWVMQERNLSRRILHYAEDQLYWECQMVVMSENGAIRDTPNLKRSLKPLDFVFAATPANDSGTNELIGGWRSLLPRYTATKLTREEDRLAALAGLARKTEEVTGDVFVAGHWKSNLHQDLWWLSTDSSKKEIDNWRAPSWSWAALEGPIDYDMWSFPHLAKSMIQVDFIKVEHEGVRLTSRIKTSGLVISATLQPVLFRPLIQVRIGEIFGYGLTTRTAFTNEIGQVGPDDAPESIFDRILLDPTNDLWSGWCTFDQGPPQPQQSLNLWAMELSRNEPIQPVEDMRGYTGTNNVLILKAVGELTVTDDPSGFMYTPSRTMRCFERLGMGQFDEKAKCFDGIQREKFMFL